MRRSRFIGLLLAAASCAVAVGCRRGPDPAAVAGHNVLFITLDTTRADRIGCYGYDKAETPTIDALAARGTLFEKAIAQVPLTLPSHSSIMTGRYPRELGVRDNARNALSDEDPTLAGIFRENGYRTGAFVAAFVLDSQFGLDRGFDVYRDEMGHQHKGADPMHAQQPGDVITDRALSWLQEDSDKPFFAWVHYYDPHDPYMPPEAFRSPDRHPYDGEIAFVDTQIARIFNWLDEKGIADNTFVVVVGDHGESFNEHGEQGHTNFVYDTNMHVPLIFGHPEAVPAATRVPAVVELVDVFPTTLELFGFDAPRDLHGRSLAPAFAGDTLDDVYAYSESLYVYNAYGWAEQRGLTGPRWKYISSTKPELYDRVADPGEMENLILDEPRVASDMLDRLKQRYNAMPAGEGKEADLTPEAIDAMTSLGYIGAHGKGLEDEQFLTEDLRDPKDMRRVLQLYRMGRALLEKAKTKEDYAEILPLLRDVTFMCPEALQFQYTYGFCLLQAGEYDKAVSVFTEAIAIDLTHRHSLELKAEALTNLGRHEEAVAELDAAVALDPKSPNTRRQFGNALERVGRTSKAIEQFREAVRLAPGMLKAYAKLCTLLDDAGELREIIEKYEHALEEAEAAQASPRVDPTISAEELARAQAERIYDLGVCYTRVNDTAKAKRAFEKAVELSPDYGKARLNLGIAMLSGGVVEEAAPHFEETARLEGYEAEAKYHLGVVRSRQGEIEETVRLYEEAIAADPGYAAPISELAQFYRAQRRFADVVRVLERGIVGNPDDAWMLNGLGQVLATCRDDAVRDCPRGVEVLERAAERTARGNPVVLANLSAAYACTGRFAKAIDVAQEGLRLAKGSQTASIRERLETQIRLFEERETFQDPRL